MHGTDVEKHRLADPAWRQWGPYGSGRASRTGGGRGPEGKKPPLAAPAGRKGGPYVSERAWGTVREDYSPDGEAWTFFPHDHARSRTYRWSEDGLGGICDDDQLLCFAFAFWNGADPILK